MIGVGESGFEQTSVTDVTTLVVVVANDRGPAGALVAESAEQLQGLVRGCGTICE